MDKQTDKQKIAIEVLRDFALDSSMMVTERQRAIDALTIFKTSAIDALQYVFRKTDLDVLKERADLYIKRIKSGAITNLQA
jgi:hypothetical protein